EQPCAKALCRDAIAARENIATVKGERRIDDRDRRDEYQKEERRTPWLPSSDGLPASGEFEGIAQPETQPAEEQDPNHHRADTQVDERHCLALAGVAASFLLTGIVESGHRRLRRRPSVVFFRRLEHRRAFPERVP